jgi:hypothetical protein
MAKKHERKWDTWPTDTSVQYASSDGGIELRVADGEGYRHSGWCKLLGDDLDATIRQLLREMQGGVKRQGTSR